MENTDPLESNAEDTVIKGHQYDGIQEYDNPMPGWWVGIFIGSFFFAIFYVVGIQTGYINTYEKDLEASLADLETIRTTYAAAQPAFSVDEVTLENYANDAARIEAGAASFVAQCAACHGADGQGLIGPNLTDAYWIKGGENTDIFAIITEGSLEKGMPPWEAVYSPEQRAELVAFIRSIEGTSPENPKAAEGELFERSAS
ncbi:MAG: cbb3-type cytochrome c oxidase N-terminal domain-containing protein [Bacteroidota bacterium]